MPSFVAKIVGKKGVKEGVGRSRTARGVALGVIIIICIALIAGLHSSADTDVKKGFLYGVPAVVAFVSFILLIAIPELGKKGAERI